MSSKNVSFSIAEAVDRHTTVANLLASVSLFMQYSSLIDRLANALSIDAVQRVVYEAYRILSTLIDGKDEYIKEIKEEDKYNIVVRVKSRGAESEEVKEAKPKESFKEYHLYGRLPTSYEIDEFIKDSSKDIRVARVIAASAMARYARALSRGGT